MILQVIIVALLILLIVESFYLIKLVQDPVQPISDEQLARRFQKENEYLVQLRQQIEMQMRQFDQRLDTSTKKVKTLLFEFDQDYKHAKNDMQKELVDLCQKIPDEFAHILDDLQKQKLAYQKIVQVGEKKRLLLSRVVKRSQSLIHLFQNDWSPEKILDELESLKIKETKALLAKGVSEDVIASELGLDQQEVRSIVSYL